MIRRDWPKFLVNTKAVKAAAPSFCCSMKAVFCHHETAKRFPWKRVKLWSVRCVDHCAMELVPMRFPWKRVKLWSVRCVDHCAVDPRRCPRCPLCHALRLECRAAAAILHGQYGARAAVVRDSSNVARRVLLPLGLAQCLGPTQCLRRSLSLRARAVHYRVLSLRNATRSL